ncbi:MAG TPA: HD domain-containing phosphohydrolase [bacterium]
MSSKRKKILIIILIITLITLFQFTSPMFLKEDYDFASFFYFIPVIFAGYWFGFYAGIITGIISMGMEGLHSFLYFGLSNPFEVILKGASFMLLGGVAGHIVESERIERDAKDAAHIDLIKAVSGTLDARDPYTEGHSIRVASIAKRIALKLKLSAGNIKALYEASLLHDVGNIGVDDSFLKKRGRLTPNEFAEIKRHPQIGAKILKEMEYFKNFILAVRHHHEMYDGSGYPDGLEGNRIPLLARIIAVADAYDAMISDRPYRNRMSHESAVEEIKKHSGQQFDPAVVKAFFEIGFEFVKPPSVITHIDPVCKMKINEISSAIKHDYNGKTHYFCANSCKEKFIETPEKYLGY